MANHLSARLSGPMRAGLIISSSLLAIASSAQAFAQTVDQDELISQNNSGEQFVARALVQSNARLEIRSQLSAPVSLSPFRVGETFAKNDILIAFDCARYQAEWKAAKAGANAAWVEYKSKKRLLAHQAIGRDEVTLAGAVANKATAEAKVTEVINADCEIKAPFDGRVAARFTKPGEYPSSDSPLMIILDDSDLELEVLVPSKWLVWLNKGQALSFTIDETAETIGAKVTRIGAEIDPVSQTIRVYASLNTEGKSVLAGMSGQVVFAGGS